MSCVNTSHLINTPETRESDKFLSSLRSTIPTPFLVFGDKDQFNVSLAGNFLSIPRSDELYSCALTSVKYLFQSSQGKNSLSRKL